MVSPGQPDLEGSRPGTMGCRWWPAWPATTVGVWLVTVTLAATVGCQSDSHQP